MSENAGERGEIKIPRGEWSGLRRRLIEGWNALLARHLELARELHAHLKAVARGKHPFDYALEAGAWVERKRQATSGDLGLFAAGRAAHWDPLTSVDIVDLALTEASNGRIELRPLMKQALPWASSANRHYASHALLHWEGDVRLQDDTYTLLWTVNAGDGTVQRAWSHPMGLTLRSALANIRWIRMTGGVLVRSEETHGESGAEKATSQQVTRRYGPLGVGRENWKR